jgi:hypothetical protein
VGSSGSTVSRERATRRDTTSTVEVLGKFQ